MDLATQFVQQITDIAIVKAEKEVLRRAKQITRHINTNAVDMDPLEVYEYFGEILHKIELELEKWAKPFSSEQWLWYLRRVPEPVLSGRLPSTFVYDISLAEVYSASSSTRYQRQHSGSMISFPVTRNIVHQVLKFCRMVRQVSRIHTNLRYAGKGVSFKFVDPDDYLPHPHTPDDLQEAINLFDQRIETQSLSFGRAGTVVAEAAKDNDDSKFNILLVSRLATPTIAPNVWQLMRNETPAQQLLYRFVPIYISLEKFIDLANKEAVSQTDWVSQDILSLLALQRTMMYLMTRSKGINYNVPLVGYSVHSYTNLCIDELNVYNEIIADLENALPVGRFPQSMHEALGNIMNLDGQTYPLKPGPVIRRSGDMIFLDWYSMTHQLNYLLEFPKLQGEVANERAEHFEIAVQSSINKTDWQPNAQLLALRGRDLSYTENGCKKAITDIDAIGEKDGILLMVSCKANVFSAEYDIGDYRTVRNQASNVENYVDDWMNKKKTLQENMVGDNYDFSGYSKIIAVVCTPRPVYVPIGRATDYETDGLFKAVSVVELENWLD